MKGIDMGKKQASKMQIKNIADKLGLSVSTVSGCAEWQRRPGKNIKRDAEESIKCGERD